MGNDIAISRTLTYWLRHRPDAAGLDLDLAGWAKVDAVLAALARSGHRVGWEQLVGIVASNDKQRFELSGDAALIRARQGHSVAVEADWRAAQPPDCLWHGTVDRFLASILAEGLMPMPRHHVHLAADRDTAERVGRRRGTPVLLAVDAGRLATAGHPFWLTGNGVWLTTHVPTTALRRA